MGIFKKKQKVSPHAAINYKGKLLNDNTPFAVAESFKSLRTNLLFMSNSERCPVYGVVSSFQATGKSLISANLAIAFSLMNKKVLLIDADMRKPVQHRVFNLHHGVGFSELLSGQCTTDDTLRSVENYQNLTVISSGAVPPNPQELLASDQAAKVFAELKQRFDVIVVDFPPAGVVADAMAASSLVTGFVFITMSGVSEGPAVTQTIETMKQMNCNILGTVLNGYDLKSGDYYRDKRYGRYSYYRGDYRGDYRRDKPDAD